MQEELRILLARMNKAVDRFLQGTYNHFFCELPARIGSIWHFLFKVLFFRIQFSKDQVNIIRDLPKDAGIIVVNKYRSTFEYFFSYIRFSSIGISTPTIALNYRFLFLNSFKKFLRISYVRIHHLLTRRPLPDLFREGYLERRILEGNSVFMSLVEKRDFYQRFVQQKTDPLQYLIELQTRTDRPIFIVPQLFFYTKAPATSAMKFSDIFFGFEQRPGKIRKLFKALVRPEKMFVELSQPVNLKRFIHQYLGSSLNTEHLALILRRDLLSQITRHRQSTTGPVLKSYDEIKQNILTEDELQAYMKRYANRRNVSLYRSRGEAVRYFDEIAAKYRPGFVGLSVRIVRWLSTTIFDGISVDAEQLKKIKGMALKGPVIFVPCHRSHIDSMIMLTVMYTHHMSPPHIVAGKNLSFWPLGPLLRMAGVFFVRRSFKGAVFYTKVFSAYIFKLLEEGFHINVFIEGTRSRSGKLLQPQLGMITILLDSFLKGACRDLIFVPVYIGYDRVPEESEYLIEIEGGQKKPESAKQLLKAGKMLKKRFGKIYVKFNDPISLDDFIQQMDLPCAGLSSKQKHMLCRQLGNKIMNDIDQATIVTPQSLVAGALLNSQKPIRSFEHLMKDVETYIAFLASKRAALSESLAAHPYRTVARVLNRYGQVKIIETVQAKQGVWQPTDTFIVKNNKRPILEYYKNNCITHFVPAAYAALSILTHDAFQFQMADIVSDYRFLEDFFSFEFTHDPEQLSDYYLRKSVKAFIDDAILTPHPTLPDTYNITSPGYRKLKQFAAFLTPFFESYWVVLNWMSQESRTHILPKDRLKKIINWGHQMHRQRTIERKESLSRLNLENAIRYFAKKGLRGNKDLELIRLYENRIARYRNWLAG